jgi:hypothetical protein
MKTIDLSREQPSLADVLLLAKSESVVIRSSSGEDYLLEHADEFEREAAVLGGSDRFMAFLESRSRQQGDIPIEKVRRQRGM